jgi:hypothetical protein
VPNKKQKQQMRVEKRRKAKAESQAAFDSAYQHELAGLEERAKQQTQLGIRSTVPKLPIKTRKGVKISEK